MENRSEELVGEIQIGDPLSLDLLRQEPDPVDAEAGTEVRELRHHFRFLQEDGVGSGQDADEPDTSISRVRREEEFLFDGEGDQAIQQPGLWHSDYFFHQHRARPISRAIITQLERMDRVSSKPEVSFQQRDIPYHGVELIRCRLGDAC